MKGDFTRDTFDPSKHYSSVRLQQGRVQLDADWNEQRDIEAHRDQTTTCDVIGLCGAPLKQAGIASPPQAQAGFAILPLLPLNDNLVIEAGHYYVDGILCENETDVLFTQQDDFPLAPPLESPPVDAFPPVAGLYLAYLDVWQRHMTALEDPRLREVALNGPDTATRTKTIWQVKAVRVGALNDSIHCLSEPAEWLAETAPGTGQIQARAQPSPETSTPCDIPPGAGYRRLENQLYRVEIHQAGSLNTATFKWSRDNGSIVTPWLSQNGNELTVGSLGRDTVLRFAAGQWVELTDDTRELRGEMGTLVQLDNAEGQVLTIDPATATGSVSLADFPRKPKVRRWDMPSGELQVEIPATNDGWIPLEDGVEIRFQPGTYQTGDYWLIPARPASGDIEWPQDAPDTPRAQLPDGICHHYCRLALLSFDGTAWTLLSDCRHLFPPVTELTSLFYVGGDGQEVTPDPTLPAPPAPLLPLPQDLQLGVANGSHPVQGARVRFSVSVGDGRLQGNVTTVDVVTGADGIASCAWSLDSTTQSQQVEASLLDAAGDVVHVPVRFSANLSIAREVAYDPSACPDLNAAGVRTVQAAIDQLCQQAPQQEPGVRIRRIQTVDNVPLSNDVLVPVSRLARGIDIQCDASLSQESGGGVPANPPSTFPPHRIPAKPTCFVTLDLPYPIGPDQNVWGPNIDVIGFQPLILGSEVSIQDNTIIWRPTPVTMGWLLQLLFQTLGNQEVTDRILAHLTIKGNFIWLRDGNPNPDVYLDGEAFGRPSLDGSGRVDLGLPSGDGRRGGDFEMWFWLMPG